MHPSSMRPTTNPLPRPLPLLPLRTPRTRHRSPRAVHLPLLSPHRVLRRRDPKHNVLVVLACLRDTLLTAHQHLCIRRGSIRAQGDGR